MSVSARRRTGKPSSGSEIASEIGSGCRLGGARWGRKMTNRTIILSPQTSHVTERVTEHVHEHRAPTDESVRLLSEMEKAARDKIVEAIHVGDTTFECVVHIERRFADDSTYLIAVFSLN